MYACACRIANARASKRQRSDPGRFDSIVRDPNAVCKSLECKGTKGELMISCADCGRGFHGTCLDLPKYTVLNVSRDPEWCCIECRSCAICHDPNFDDKMLFCDDCDRGFHTFCLPEYKKGILRGLPQGRWACSRCMKCKGCGSSSPGPNANSKWRMQYSLCEPCERKFRANRYCPVCLKTYKADDATPMVQCDKCDLWTHAACEGFSEAEYNRMERENLDFECINCRSGKQDILGPLETIVDAVQKATQDVGPILVNQSMDSDDACDVCALGTSLPTNNLVKCQMCSVVVHQACYGILRHDSGPWHCDACVVRQSGTIESLRCSYCPRADGAIKRTDNEERKWCHVLCAVMIPELGFGDVQLLMPVTGAAAVPKARWRLPCNFCKQRSYAPIQCAEKRCCTSYHVSCARENGCKLNLVMQPDAGPAAAQASSFCLKHG